MVLGTQYSQINMMMIRKSEFEEDSSEDRFSNKITSCYSKTYFLKQSVKQHDIVLLSPDANSRLRSGKQ